MNDLARKAKIRWQCRRGMLELDLLLTGFINKNLDSLQEQQLAAFEKLLAVSDPQLYSWLMAETSPHEQELLAIVKFIQMHDSI